ncbi:hypothetical protein SBA4_400004 [Candidatus Sulfopaludibacter sp. SbA4]|nr:hypothetical protein SBA4_400004 [Candidatus Sulfopaludibacter sp. SbA4]
MRHPRGKILAKGPASAQCPRAAIIGLSWRLGNPGGGNPQLLGEGWRNVAQTTGTPRGRSRRG